MAEEEQSRYQVQYLDGEQESCTYLKRVGRARVTYPNGDTYEGGFDEERRRHGHGTYTWKLRKAKAGGEEEEEEEQEEEQEDAKKVVPSYVGDYEHGKRHGLGRMTFPNGNVYHGEWHDDKPHKQGTCVYANGDVYCGQWRMGTKHGEGTYVFAKDGSRLVGQWDRGTITSGEWQLKDGTTFRGEFSRGKPVGGGTFSFPTGIAIQGEFCERIVPGKKQDRVQLQWHTAPKSLRVAGTQ